MFSITQREVTLLQRELIQTLLSFLPGLIIIESNMETKLIRENILIVHIIIHLYILLL